MTKLEDNGYFIKTLFRKFALPTVFALLVSTISTWINSLMAGNYFGGSGLASLGIVSPMFFLFATIGALIGAGSSNVASKYMSNNNLEEVNKLYSTALIIAVISGVLVSILGIVFKSSVLSILGGGAQIGAVAYYNNYIPFGVFTILVYIPMYFARIDGKPKVGLYMFIAMAVTNMVANFVLVTYFKMGIEAIALGTSVGAFGASMTGFVFLRKKDSNIRFIKPSGAEIVNRIYPISASGSPMALNNVLSLIKTLALNGLIIKLATSGSLAVIAVLWTLNSFSFAILSGFGQAIIPLIGVFNEEKDSTSIVQVIKHSLLTGYAIFSFLCIILIIFWEQTYAIFGLSEVGQNEKFAMIFFSLSLIFSVSNVIISFYFTVSKKIWIANIITLGRGVLFIIPIAYIFSGIYGTIGIWVSFLLAEIGTFLLSLICAYFYSRKDENLSFPLLIYKNKEKYISFSVDNNTNDIAYAAGRVEEFCNENELLPKQTMLISLSIEELLGLIMSKSQSKSYSSTAVRILISEEAIVIRIRYAGEKFNPINYYKTNISDDIEKNIDIIGIKYIVSTAKNIDYLETFGINNLVIGL